MFKRKEFKKENARNILIEMFEHVSISIMQERKTTHNVTDFGQKQSIETQTDEKNSEENDDKTQKKKKAVSAVPIIKK